MKSNLKTKILLGATAVVWIAVVVMLFNHFGPEELDVPEPTLVSQFKPKSLKAKDTFSIQTVSRDPFLGTLTNKKNTNSKKVKSNKGATEKQLAIITFGGVIKNQESSKQVFVVNINNKQYLLKKGQTVEEVKVLRGTTKELVVIHNNKTLKIPIQ